MLIEIFGASGRALRDDRVSVLAIVFAEMLPKTIAIASPESVALYLARPMSWSWRARPGHHRDRAHGPADAAALRLRLGENAPILSANQEIRGQVDLLHEEGGVAKI